MINKPIKTMKTKKRLNTVWLVAQWLKKHKKTYIHDLKVTCKANNPMNRIMQLKRTHGWNVLTVYEGIKDGVKVFHYQLIKEGNMPQKFI